MLDRYPVTNQQFADFVTATGYKTVAEQTGNGYVYTEDYWDEIEGAAWNHPAGPHSSIDDRMNHPVVHMSSVDAQAYAHWASKRLPREQNGSVQQKAMVMRSGHGVMNGIHIIPTLRNTGSERVQKHFPHGRTGGARNSGMIMVCQKLHRSVPSRQIVVSLEFMIYWGTYMRSPEISISPMIHIANTIRCTKRSLDGMWPCEVAPG